MKQDIRYWKQRLSVFKEFGIRMRHVEDILIKFPDDYILLRKTLQTTIKNNHLNLLYCHQEIATLLEEK